MKSNAPCLYKDKKSGVRCYNDVDGGSGYCKTHREPFKNNWWGADLPKDWPRRRESVIRRDKGLCYICLQEGREGKGADGAEHIIPRNEGGSDELFNLKAVHDKVAPYCHRTKTAQDANRAKAQYKPKRRGQ
jgi:5-methylcytosine-specific restriction protein A